MRTGMAREKIIMGWSGGEDNALALREILRQGHYEDTALVTTCTEGDEPTNIARVRHSLLERPVGLPRAGSPTICPPMSTRAARTANSTLLSFKARFFDRLFVASAAKLCGATTSTSPIFCPRLKTEF